MSGKQLFIDVPLVGAGLLAVSLALAAFWPSEDPAAWKGWLAWVVIGVVDCYLAFVLALSALRSDDKTFIERRRWVRRLFPSRSAGLLLALLMMVAVVLAFGRWYLLRPGMFADMSAGRALYISLGTIGLNDFGPLCNYARGIVAFEMFSSILLVTCVLGLLVSRLSSYVDYELTATTTSPAASVEMLPWFDVEGVLSPLTTALQVSEGTRADLVTSLESAMDEVRAGLKRISRPTFLVWLSTALRRR